MLIPLISEGKGFINISYEQEDRRLFCEMCRPDPWKDFRGGYGVIQAPVSVPEVNTQVSLTLNPQATQCTVPSCDPVDMATGFWMDNNTDLSLSGGSTGGVALKR